MDWLIRLVVVFRRLASYTLSVNSNRPKLPILAMVQELGAGLGLADSRTSGSSTPGKGQDGSHAAFLHHAHSLLLTNILDKASAFCVI